MTARQRDRRAALTHVDAAAPAAYDSTMPRWQLRYAIACCAIIGWSLAYTLASWGGWTKLFYDPLSRRWWWGDTAATPIPINYWGLVLWGIGGAAFGVAVAAIAARLWRRPLPGAVQLLLGAWAMTGFAYAGTYYMWTLWPF